MRKVEYAHINQLLEDNLLYELEHAGFDNEVEKIITSTVAKELHTGEQGKKLIKTYEGLHDGDLSKIGLQPKLCPAGIWTVGWGHAIRHPKTGKYLKEKDKELAYALYPVMTLAEADSLLEADLIKFENIVKNEIIDVESLTQNQFDALVSHTYNTGGSTTLFNLVNQKATDDAIFKWFTEHYITSNGVPLLGLRRRRLTEAQLFLHNKLHLYNA